jgi:hypothetical protein
MQEILLINPKKKKRAKRKKTVSKKLKPKRRKTTTRRRTTRRAAPRRTTKTTIRRSVSMAKRKRTKKRRSPRKNPARSRARRSYSRARATFAGLNIKGALKDVPATQLGMFATKWLAKRFGPAASEIDPESWDWSSYLKGGLGAVVAGYLAQMVKPGLGQKVMAGGLNLIIYKMLQNELVVQSEWAKAQFGADEDDEYYPDEYAGTDNYLPGDVETDASGNTYLLGEDNQWYELPEESVSGVGDVLEPVGPLGAYESGASLRSVGPLGDDDAYRKMLLDA